MKLLQVLTLTKENLYLKKKMSYLIIILHKGALIGKELAISKSEAEDEHKSDIHISPTYSGNERQ